MESQEKPLVALDRRETRRMSSGMIRYSRELAARLPRVAPDLAFDEISGGDNFGFDENVRLPLEILRGGADLTHYLCLHAPVFAPRPYVVTIHDLIHLRFPQYFKKSVGPYYRTVVRFQLARAERIITDDERTVDDIVELLGADRRKIRVIALGASDVFFAQHEPHHAPRPYFFYAGNHFEHKDLPTLARAWASLPSELDVDLYLTGSGDVQALRAEFARERGGIVVLGDVGEEELARYYAGAVALVHPSLREGFGLPMLEAMAQGCCVVACRDAVPAVIKDGVFAFAPGDAHAAATAMQRLLIDEPMRRAVGMHSRTLAEPFTWDRCAAETAQVYREVLED
ncbi:MAG TPA: glycosyltransferase family 1 protein [Candidatus Baltobacteraceae bacterium]|nr:glycosyltransferase family 1 protein [Candidatus Baltobacteraceae bacterium]